VFELGRWPNYAYGCDCNYLMCVCCVFVCVCVYVCVCVSLSVTNEWRLKYFKQASRYLGLKWATYCRCVSLSACCRIPSYQLRQPANLRITFRRVTCSDDRLNLNIACTHLRDDQWKNDDCAPAAASESFGIKVLIYSGLLGASQRQEPFVGPIWPIIGTTQGVATEVAACAYDTFFCSLGYTFKDIYILDGNVYLSHLQYLRIVPPTNGFQISSNLFREHVVLFEVVYISWAKAF
jgi:hypothetical protein